MLQLTERKLAEWIKYKSLQLKVANFFSSFDWISCCDLQKYIFSPFYHFLPCRRVPIYSFPWIIPWILFYYHNQMAIYIVYKEKLDCFQEENAINHIFDIYYPDFSSGRKTCIVSLLRKGLKNRQKFDLLTNLGVSGRRG